MAELMDALYPFYEIVSEDDDEDDVVSKAAAFSAGPLFRSKYLTTSFVLICACLINISYFDEF